MWGWATNSEQEIQNQRPFRWWWWQRFLSWYQLLQQWRFLYLGMSLAMPSQRVKWLLLQFQIFAHCLLFLLSSMAFSPSYPVININYFIIIFMPVNWIIRCVFQVQTNWWIILSKKLSQVWLWILNYSFLTNQFTEA